MGSQVGNLAKDWHWALRVGPCGTCGWCSCAGLSGVAPCPQVTPGLGLIAVLLLLFVVREPKRGAVEARPEHHLHRTSWLMDLQDLSKK